MRLRVLILILFVAGWAFPSTRKFERCAADTLAVAGFPIKMRAEANLPDRREMAVAIVSRIHWASELPNDSPRLLYAYFPMPSRKEKLINLSTLSIKDPLPERFIIGDGSLKRVLVGVDRSPGSPLSVHLQRLRRQIEKQSNGRPFPHVVTDLLQNYSNCALMPVRGDDHSGNAQLPWDKRLPDPPSFSWNLEGLPDDHPPIRTGYHLPVVPLEYFLDRVDAYCGQAALLNTLLLRLLGNRSRLVNGAVASSQKSDFTELPGHSWDELDEGLILDSSLNLKEVPIGFGRLQSPAPGEYPSHFYSNEWVGIPSLLQRERAGEKVRPWRIEYNRFFIVSLD